MQKERSTDRHVMRLVEYGAVLNQPCFAPLIPPHGAASLRNRAIAPQAVHELAAGSVKTLERSKSRAGMLGIAAHLVLSGVAFVIC